MSLEGVVVLELIYASPVRSFLASPNVGAGSLFDDAIPSPSNASPFGRVDTVGARRRFAAPKLGTRGVIVAFGASEEGIDGPFDAPRLAACCFALGSNESQSFSAKSSPNPGVLLACGAAAGAFACTAQASSEDGFFAGVPACDETACHAFSSATLKSPSSQFACSLLGVVGRDLDLDFERS